jgi:hypothetical protein
VHQELRRRLIELVSSDIASLRVQSGKYLRADGNAFQAAEAALDGKLRTRLANVVSDTPFKHFAFGWLSDRLWNQFRYDSKAEERPLTALEGYADHLAVAELLVNEFAELPQAYTFVFPLGLTAGFADSPVGGEPDYLLGAASLLCVGPTFDTRFEVRQTGFTLADIAKGDWSGGWASGAPGRLPHGTLCLVFRRAGFMSRSIETNLASEVCLFVRAVAGLLESSYLVEATAPPLFSDTMYGGFPRETWVYGFRDRGDSVAPAEWVGSTRFENDHAARLGSLRWVEDRGEMTQWKDWIPFVQLSLRPALGWHLETKEGDVRILRAAQWYFDSLCGANELLQFVQATVALEILLGDTDAPEKISLSELLANRCAYSLAETDAERTKLLAKFRDIYSTRSRIVHRGKAILSDGEREQLWSLRSLCRRVLHHEIRLIMKSAMKKRERG